MLYNGSFSRAFLSELKDQIPKNYDHIILENIKIGRIINPLSSSSEYIDKFINEFQNPSEAFYVELNDSTIFQVSINLLDNEEKFFHFKDVTKLKRELEISSVTLKKMEVIMENIFSGVILFNNIGFISYYNKPAQMMFSDINKQKLNLKNRNIESLFQNLKLIEILDKKNHGIVFESKGIRLGESQFPIEVIINKLDTKWSLAERRKQSREIFVATLRDISESKKLSFQLQQSQKMDAIGALASGIAHDFNNILSVIMGYSSLLKSKEGSEGENIDQILNATDRAKKLVRQILNYSKPSKNQISKMDLSGVITEVADFVRQTVPSSININVRIPDKKIIILGDEGDIHRCMLNLLTNSANAIGLLRGNISINLKVLQDSKKVLISIADDGPGIKPEIQSKIFDPFFSTKDKSQGTGLGLSMVQRIIEDHNGSIYFKSTVNQGTNFELTLPIIDSQTRYPVGYNVNGQTNKKSVKNKIKELIVFVDDEELIVKVSSKILAREGYDVKSFTESNQALVYIENNLDEISLVISDENMPNLKGTELAEKIRIFTKKLPIILCSGYSEGIRNQEIERIGINKIVSKPISADELLEIVHNLLD